MSRLGLLLILMVATCAVCLLLVYLNRSREESRRTMCLERIRKISSATQMYHFEHGRLPACTLGDPEFPSVAYWESDGWNRHQCTSSLASIITQMDFPALYYHNIYSIHYGMTLADHKDTSGNRINDWFGEMRVLRNNFQSLEASIQRELICPSDPGVDSTTKIAVMSQPVIDISSNRNLTKLYTLCWSSEKLSLARRTSNLPESDAPKWTNYLGCFGVPDSLKTGIGKDFENCGALTVREKNTFQTISEQDGLGCTILYGETVGEIIGRERTSIQSWFLGGLGHGFGKFHWKEGWPGNNIEFGNANEGSVFGFGSFHDDAVNFSFCDLSVHSISRDIDRNVFEQLSGRNDGVTVEMSSISR
jgi:hypothetical protein